MLLVFETRGPSRDSAVEEVLAAACRAHEHGRGAMVVLIQEGVMHALQAVPDAIRGLLDLGVPVLADRFSLALRGIEEGRLPAGIAPVDMPEIAELLGRDGVQPLWH